MFLDESEWVELADMGINTLVDAVDSKQLDGGQTSERIVRCLADVPV